MICPSEDTPSLCPQPGRSGWCTRWSFPWAGGAPSEQRSLRCVWGRAWTGHSRAQTSPLQYQPLRRWKSQPAPEPVWCLSESAGRIKSSIKEWSHHKPDSLWTKCQTLHAGEVFTPSNHLWSHNSTPLNIWIEGQLNFNLANLLKWNCIHFWIEI